ncbi:MAG: glycoside hydrolase family 27 protein [Ruminococcus sp.]|nr:glycoside hydrolase family 27 protein [Ruminococcus sp.]
MSKKTPPMGWNSWDCWGAAVSEETVRKNAEFIAGHLKQYGWEYVVVDIQWSEPTAENHEYHPFTELCMDEYSRLIPAENRFPSSAGGKGFAPLAEYIHSLGLKFGIHIMRGIPRQAVHRNTALLGTDKTARQIAKTASICQWNTDMYGVDPEKEGAREYYDSIFKLYAQWGVDFVKCDDICRELPHEESELELLSESLKNCGRDMVLSLSPGPALLEKADLYAKTADMWRITDDFWDKWELLYNMFERCEKWAPYVGKGGWPDADMLPVGAILQDYGKDNYSKFTPDELKVMLTLWCIFRSPLFIGGDLQNCDEATYSLLSSKGILKMLSQSENAAQLYRRSIDGTEAVVWTADCTEGGKYAAIFNIGEADLSLDIPISELGVGGCKLCLDLWSGKVAGLSDIISVQLKKHSCAAYLIGGANEL